VKGGNEMSRLNKDQMDKIMKGWESDDKSLDELVGYIIRNSHGNNQTPVSYKEVKSVLSLLQNYYEEN
jgi:hypothetical protein